MSIYDIEDYIKDLRDLYIAQLNTEIGIVNTAKGDFTIATINASAWYLTRLPKIFSYEQFIVWGLDETPLTDRQENSGMQTIRTFFEVVLADAGEKESESVVFKLLRYTRALQQVLNKNPNKFRGIAHPVVDRLEPTQFDVLGKLYHSAGVSIKASFSTN